MLRPQNSAIVLPAQRIRTLKLNPGLLAGCSHKWQMHAHAARKSSSNLKHSRPATPTNLLVPSNIPVQQHQPCGTLKHPRPATPTLWYPVPQHQPSGTPSCNTNPLVPRPATPTFWSRVSSGLSCSSSSPSESSGCKSAKFSSASPSTKLLYTPLSPSCWG